MHGSTHALQLQQHSYPYYSYFICSYEYLFASSQTMQISGSEFLDEGRKRAAQRTPLPPGELKTSGRPQSSTIETPTIVTVSRKIRDMYRKRRGARVAEVQSNGSGEKSRIQSHSTWSKDSDKVAGRSKVQERQTVGPCRNINGCPDRQQMASQLQQNL
jgi:hypothetical protein